MLIFYINIAAVSIAEFQIDFYVRQRVAIIVNAVKGCRLHFNISLEGELVYKYEIIIYWSKGDDAFVAEVPELPGCMAHGKSPKKH